MDDSLRETLALAWKWLAWGWAGQTLPPPLWLRRRPRPSSDRAEIALTFDDGPAPRYTLPVLEILERAGVKELVPLRKWRGPVRPAGGAAA